MREIYLIVALSIFASLSAHAQEKSWTEFIEGRRIAYKSDGGSKAKGIEIGFDYPSSWFGAEGRRPNTVYEVTSEHGKGLESCNLVIKETPPSIEHNITAQDIAEIFDPNGLQDFTPNGSKYISGNTTTIDGQPGAWVHFSKSIDRAGIQFEMMSISYMIYFNRRFINFHCGIGAKKDQQFNESHQRYAAYFPLFQQMTNSIIIYSKWK